MTRNASKSLGMPEIAVVPLPAPTVLQLRMRAHLVLLCSKYNENLFSTGGHHNGRSLAETPRHEIHADPYHGQARPVYRFRFYPGRFGRTAPNFSYSWLA